MDYGKVSEGIPGVSLGRLRGKVPKDARLGETNPMLLAVRRPLLP
jgi:hypothetical protein